MFRVGKTIILGCLLLSSAMLLASDKQYNKSFEFSPGSDLVMNLRVGSVDVRTWDRDEVAFEAEVRGSEAFVRQYDFVFETSGNRLSIKGEMPQRKWRWNVRAKVKVSLRVPQSCHLKIKTSGGNISVRDLLGPTDLRTSGGNLNLSNIEGEMIAKTSGGNIKLNNISGNMTVSTSGGDISLENLHGDIDAHTSGGNIDMDGVAGAVVAKTSGGNIHLRLEGPYQGVRASTSGGHIHCYVDGELNADLNARTSGGKVNVEFPVTISGRISKSRIQGKVNGGGPLLDLRSSGGNIKVLPAK